MSIDWENVPAGFDFFLIGKSLAAAGKPYMKVDSVQRYISATGSYVAFEDAGEFEVIARTDQPWTGEGPPPVGTVCECRVIANGEWVRCEIVAYKDHYAIAYVDENTVMLSQGIRFRPIRTPEQIAAEERIAAINYMEIDAGMCATAFDGDPEARAWITNLIDKGWRKVTP